jgi:NAD(P)-dependent dehydrogenase (short-subunit alcohol dehydrogenase family)
VVAADLNEAGAREVGASVGGAGVRCDVSKESDIRAVVDMATKEFGQVDVFCSNAGIFYVDGANAADLATDKWQRIWEVNVMAHVHAARAVLPQMLARKDGYLVQTASAAGLLNQIGSASYSVTKHAAVGFAESLAITHGDDGIMVSVVCPQGVRTAMTVGMENSPQAGDGMMEPAQVAEAVVQGMREERFLILPHPEVVTYMQRKASDYDRWIKGMRRYRRQFA